MIVVKLVVVELFFKIDSAVGDVDFKELRFSKGKMLMK